jgi:hypothetical protein
VIQRAELCRAASLHLSVSWLPLHTCLQIAITPQKVDKCYAMALTRWYCCYCYCTDMRDIDAQRAHHHEQMQYLTSVLFSEAHLASQGRSQVSLATCTISLLVIIK